MQKLTIVTSLFECLVDIGLLFYPKAEYVLRVINQLSVTEIEQYLTSYVFLIQVALMT